VGDGRKAAIQIAAKAGIVLPSERLSSDKKMSHSDFIIRKSQRQKMAAGIAGDHPEFTAESAIQEASRCLQCGDVCSVCVTVCPNRANNYYLTEAAEVPVWKITTGAGETAFNISRYLKVQQKYQVLNVADFCNECGNCTTFCPTKGSPFSDKPRICLTEKSFHQTDNGFLFQQQGDTTILLHRSGEDISCLSKTLTSYQYSNSRVKIIFDAAGFNITHVEFPLPAPAEIILSEAAEMKILIDTIPYTFLKTQHHAKEN
jgi:putative selenate reductase